MFVGKARSLTKRGVAEWCFTQVRSPFSKGSLDKLSRFIFRSAADELEKNGLVATKPVFCDPDRRRIGQTWWTAPGSGVGTLSPRSGSASSQSCSESRWPLNRLSAGSLQPKIEQTHGWCLVSCIWTFHWSWHIISITDSLVQRARYLYKGDGAKPY